MINNFIYKNILFIKSEYKMSRIQGFMSSPSRSLSGNSLDIGELPPSPNGSDVQADGNSNSSQLLYELSNDLKVGNTSTVRSSKLNDSLDDLPDVRNNNNKSSIFKTPAQIRGLKTPSLVQKVRSSKSSSLLLPSDIPDEESSIRSPLGFIQNEDLLVKLTNINFIPINNIMIRDTQGNVSAKYVKVVDSRGNTSYIEIDMDGNVMQMPGDITTSVSEDVISVPLSIKMGLYKCANLDVCGVAMECQDGVCMLLRDDDDEMEEKMLSRSSDNGEEFGIESDEFIGYPIIKLSEVLDNPILASKIIDDTTNRIQKNAINKYLYELTMFEKSQKKSIDNTNEFVNKLSNKIGLVKLNLKELDKVRSNYDLNPPKTDSEREKMLKNAYLIRQHNELFNNLISISKNVKRYEQIFSTISNDAEEINQLIDDMINETKETFNVY
uniref:Uncharacterized protein n=1 Tax=Pithovirus LCPAC101 TaxID=2506586 RepID=A0A481Z2W1_9VIRU|nr:MAG: uncharacterized protein LCPAC101_03680 [Pithovirus LCPAC101]